MTAAASVTPPSVDYLGLRFDTRSLGDLLAMLMNRDPGAPFAYLVTPNVDHMVRLHDAPADAVTIWQAYRQADWCACDSRILAALAHRDGVRLAVSPGSDLTAALLAALHDGDRIALIGGAAAVVDALRQRYPAIDILHHDPPMGLRADAAAMKVAARFVVDAKARFVFLAVGSPQQELLALAIAQAGGSTGVGLCIGAAIEFVVGQRRRAPRAWQRARLEWAFRLLAEPRRMWRRYLVTGPRIFLIARRHRTVPATTSADEENVRQLVDRR